MAMECCNSPVVNGFSSHNLKTIRHPLYQPKLSPWFDLRVFYVRISNFEVDEFTPEHLVLNHIPLEPDTILEVNGGRSSAYLECVTSQLRRDRVDKNSEEATFVNTDSIKITGSVRFEVCDGKDLLLSGTLELCNGNGFTGESKSHSKRWKMKCQSHLSAAKALPKGNKYVGLDELLPTIEVYVAGCFSGSPIILTNTLQLGLTKKNNRKAKLDSIPECEFAELNKDEAVDTLQVPELKNIKLREDHMCNDSYYPDYIEGEDGELSWFNAGVRVGVGIGLGLCVGVGLGVGLLVRTYQATSRTFKRKIL